MHVCCCLTLQFALYAIKTFVLPRYQETHPEYCVQTRGGLKETTKADPMFGLGLLSVRFGLVSTERVTPKVRVCIDHRLQISLICKRHIFLFDIEHMSLKTL